MNYGFTRSSKSSSRGQFPGAPATGKDFDWNENSCQFLAILTILFLRGGGTASVNKRQAKAILDSSCPEDCLWQSIGFAQNGLDAVAHFLPWKYQQPLLRKETYIVMDYLRTRVELERNAAVSDSVSVVDAVTMNW